MRGKSLNIAINLCIGISMVYHEACMRRGLNPEDYNFKKYDFAVNKLKSPMDYRLGYLLLSPLRVIRDFIKKLA